MVDSLARMQTASNGAEGGDKRPEAQGVVRSGYADEKRKPYTYFIDHVRQQAFHFVIIHPLFTSEADGCSELCHGNSRSSDGG